MPFDLGTQMFTDPLGVGLSVRTPISMIVKFEPPPIGQTKPVRGRSPELADSTKENRPMADRATAIL